MQRYKTQWDLGGRFKSAYFKRCPVGFEVYDNYKNS